MYVHWFSNRHASRASSPPPLCPPAAVTAAAYSRSKFTRTPHTSSRSPMLLVCQEKARQALDAHTVTASRLSRQAARVLTTCAPTDDDTRESSACSAFAACALLCSSPVRAAIASRARPAHCIFDPHEHGPRNMVDRPLLRLPSGLADTQRPAGATALARGAWGCPDGCAYCMAERGGMRRPRLRRDASSAPPPSRQGGTRLRAQRGCACACAWTCACACAGASVCGGVHGHACGWGSARAHVPDRRTRVLRPEHRSWPGVNVRNRARSAHCSFAMGRGSGQGGGQGGGRGGTTSSVPPFSCLCVVRGCRARVQRACHSEQPVRRASWP